MTTTKLSARMSTLPSFLRDAVVTVARLPSPTLMAAREAIDAIPRAAHPDITVTDGSRVVLDLAETVLAARRARVASHRRETGKRHEHADERAAMAHRLSRPIAERTGDRSDKGIRVAAQRVMRTGGSGGTTWDVTVGEVPVCYVETTRRNTEWRYRRPFLKVADHHTIQIPARWWVRVARIGDGTGVVCGRLILDAKRLIGTADGTRAIYSAILARPGLGYTAITEPAVLSCWGDVVTIKRTFAAAANERTPKAVMQRDAALRDANARVEAEARRLADLDERVLEDLEI